MSDTDHHIVRDDSREMYNPKRETPIAIQKNVEGAARAIETFCNCLGISVPKESPRRIAKMWAEFFLHPHRYDIPPFTLSVFENEEDLHELVLVKDIRFFSMCEHHLVPFFGRAHVCYIPHDKIIGLSKIPRTVDWYARRPQLQERLTKQIADFLNDQLKPKGVAVLIEAQHLCVGMRGIQKPDAITITSAIRGEFVYNAAARDEFYSLLSLK